MVLAPLFFVRILLDTIYSWLTRQAVKVRGMVAYSVLHTGPRHGLSAASKTYGICIGAYSGRMTRWIGLQILFGFFALENFLADTLDLA